MSCPLTPNHSDTDDRPYAEQTQRLVDDEVTRLMREAEHQAGLLLEQHREVLDPLSHRLLTDETVGGRIVYDLLNTSPPRVA